MNDFPSSPGSSSDDDRMRELFNDAVSDVEPHETLDAIRGRTAASGVATHRSWWLGASAAVVATAATVAAIAVVGADPRMTSAGDPGFAGSGDPSVAQTTEDPTPTPEPSMEPSTDPTPTEPDATQDAQPSTPVEPSEPDPTSDTGGSSTPATPTDVTVPVYYVGETFQGPRLYREFHGVTTTDGLSAALQISVAGEATDEDYTSPWPAGTSVTADHDETAGLITVDLANDGTGLRGRPAGMSADRAAMAVEQLVYTAQAATQTRAPVQLLLGGERTDTVLGVPAAEPLAQGDPLSTLAPVWVIDPADEAEVRSGFTVSGLAAAFEANVQWELMQGDTVVRDGFTMTAEAFTMSPYSFTVEAPPGEYTLVVHDSDASGRGNVFRDTKNLTIVP